MAKTKELLPVSLQGDKNVEALCEAQDHVFSLEDEVYKLLIYPRIDSLSGEVLDLLAWQFHIEGWELADTEEKKRALIKRAIALHRLKGTPAGIKFAAAQAGSKVLRLIEPTKYFLSPGLSKEEKNKWLRQFPQLRIYPRRERAKKQGMLFFKDYLGSTFALRTDAIVRMTVRATLVKDGKEVDLVTPFWQYEYLFKNATLHVKIPGKAKFASFAGRAIPHLARTDASVRTLWIEKTVPYIEEKRRLSIKTITPGFKAVHSDSEWISEMGTQRTMFCDSAKSFFVARTDAVNRMYHVYYLFDPDKAAWKRKGGNYLGITRLTMPHHLCEVTIDVVRKVPVSPYMFSGRAVYASDKSHVQRVLRNMRNWSRCSVKTLISTQKYKPIKASYIHTSSEKIFAGQYIWR